MNERHGTDALLSAARRANFLCLASIAGGPTVLAELVGGSRGWYASAARGASEVGQVMARNIEHALNLPGLWMDKPGRTHSQIASEVGPILARLVTKRNKRRKRAGGRDAEQ